MSGDAVGPIMGNAERTDTEGSCCYYHRHSRYTKDALCMCSQGD